MKFPLVSSSIIHRALRMVTSAFALLTLMRLVAADLTLEADLREATRGLVHVQLNIPVQAGPVTLLYPKWIPGEHAPTGPAANLAIQEISAGGRRLPWRRDLENMYAFHVEVPAGISALVVKADYLAPDSGWGFSAAPMASAKLAILNWSVVALYPQGTPASGITVQPSLILPAGWKFGTSLEVAQQVGETIRFKPVTLEMLIDQPVIAGANFKRLDLTPGGSPSHVIDVAADSEAALALSAERLKAFQRVPLEYAALMGARHYETYHFLLSLSEHTGFDAVEHHQCSDNRAPERYLIDDDTFLSGAHLLPHEYFHSWNGKHRRPAGLLSDDYQKPMHDDLLWVYEGLTNYYGEVLAARAGLITADQYRDGLAASAAWLANQTGRTSRPLQDTADAAAILYSSGPAWSSRRRAAWDFYAEGSLIWLEADVLIRTKSSGTKSLDDFARLFFGDSGGGVVDPAKVSGRKPDVVTYEAADVFAALNTVMPYDWKMFFTNRLTEMKAEPPMHGITDGGWKLTFTDAPNKTVDANDKARKSRSLGDSLGLILGAEDHHIIDVVAGSPADKAGAGPGMKILGVNGRVYSDDLLNDALKATKERKSIELLVENVGYFSTLRLDYDGGARHPHLERNADAPDLVGAIVKPQTAL